MTDNPLGHEDIISQCSIQLQQAITLDESASYRPDYVLRAHITSSFLADQAMPRSRDSTKLQMDRL
ncbi:UNVERIFIED_ORG: hypothetical protein ABIC62_006532 [Burkholderia sp. 1595]|uniref:Uncharacterized protein n=1 Tax=Paraburkholderia terricola TaxID=169427 RepID=A0ABU1M260_9BURK|nr:hypothetical protein [Paraburkholderia terricola]MDR6485444.1 hypothetical protein [Paraburkholderia terricola]